MPRDTSGGFPAEPPRAAPALGFAQDPHGVGDALARLASVAGGGVSTLSGASDSVGAMRAREPVKLYFDYKSPFTYVAMAPAFELPERYAVEVRWIPFLLRIKGPGQRSIYSDWKAKYSYMDARRAANRLGGLRILGPQKIYDSAPALAGGLFA